MAMAAPNFFRAGALLPCRLAFAFFLLFSSSSTEAVTFLVNGKRGLWTIPSSPDQYNKWAETKRFEMGDSIVLKYDSKVDSVLQVNEEDYKSCNKDNPIKAYDDGNTKILLHRSGNFFFISGADGHCKKGQKLVVDVMSVKHHAISPVPSPHLRETTTQAPSPSPTAFNGGHTILSTGHVAFMIIVCTLAGLILA